MNLEVSIYLYFASFNILVSAKSINFTFPDLDVLTTGDDGYIINLEAYKSNRNDFSEIKDLKWHSVGVPSLLATKTETSKLAKLFHVTREGFYTHVEFLTNQQKKLLATEASNIHDATIEPNQIKMIILSSISCELSIVEGNLKYSLESHHHSINKYPVRLMFEYANGTKERETFENRLKQLDQYPLTINCHVRNKDSQFKYSFSLSTDKYLTKLIPIFVPPGSIVSMSSDMLEIRFHDPGKQLFCC